MPFWRAIGLGIGLVVLRLLVPAVWDGIEGTLIKFFGVLAQALDLGSNALGSVEPGQIMSLTKLK